MSRIALIAGTYAPDRCGVADYTDRLRTALSQLGIESVVLTTVAAAQGADVWGGRTRLASQKLISAC